MDGRRRLAWRTLMVGQSSRAAVLALLLASASPMAAAADPVEDFYRGKQIQLVIGFGVGNGFDTYARVLARHIGQHIPGQPSIVVQNMPGAGSLKALNYLLTVAPKDGTAFGLINPTATTDPLFYPSRAKFDPRRLAWIGSMTSDTNTCGFWTREPVTVETLRQREFVVGGTALTSGTIRADKVLASVLGLKFKIVSGYHELGSLTLAAEKGEVQGYCGVMVSTLKVNLWDRYQAGAIQIPLQAALEKDPDLPDSVPNALDLAKTDDDRALIRLFVGPWYYGRPFLAPPDIPADRLEALRSAFMRTHKDPAFLAEAAKIKLNVRPLTAAQIEKTISQIYDTPRSVIERARPIMGGTP
jgi:tripartite-type tricarboxylate transporter receptor subunit TctC